MKKREKRKGEKRKRTPMLSNLPPQIKKWNQGVMWCSRYIALDDPDDDNDEYNDNVNHDDEGNNDGDDDNNNEADKNSHLTESPGGIREPRGVHSSVHVWRPTTCSR